MIEQNLDNLRKLLATNGFDGYIVPTTDEYLSEYTPTHAKRLEYITGFTGSNGLAIILQDVVLFFTDGRYTNQAKQQLDDALFEIFDQALLSDFPWGNYIQDAAIAYDPKLFTSNKLKIFGNLNLTPSTSNLIDAIWKEQPETPNSEIYEYPLEYAGQSYLDKIQQCREILKENNAESLVITDSDSVCWLFNIRSHDVEFSPLLLAHSIITKNEAYIFADNDRCENDLKLDNVTFLNKEEFENIINKLSGKILYDANQCSTYVANIIKHKDNESVKNPCMIWKALKNPTEIKHMQKGHVTDAVAVCEILAFIASENLSEITEYDIGLKLTELRSKGANYVFDSFPTICGFKENGAIIHYKAEKESAKKIEGDGLLLIDSGGQYFGATTDITRTVAIGSPSKEHKKYYTNVLKGHIGLGDATFPEGKVTGAHLDILARQHLWSCGSDYAHGTGHGVGSFLSVHEGPQNISLAGFATKIEKGMVMSDEPGYYVDGEFGIRIENMMYVKNAKHKGFLQFEMLTLVPYAKDLIDFDMLTRAEINWLKTYYTRIEESVVPLLSDRGKKWLKTEIDVCD